MYNIPVLFIIFNRKETASQAFQRIRQAKPVRLYVAQDGPRGDNADDEAKIRDTRQAIINAIDWECEVKTLFQDTNLGCCMGVYTAISWLFENEEMGIVIEDDCIADDTFFAFAEEMLMKYKDDQRIGMIAGTNPIMQYTPRCSYLFSRFKSCWGWATWRRAWNNMDLNMQWRETDLRNVINNSGFNGKHNSKWYAQLKCIDNGAVSSWDWPWYFSLAAQNQLCIYPACNLVSNVGNGADATHTSLASVTYKATPLSFPLVHPRTVTPDCEFDRLFSKRENTLYWRIHRMIPLAIRKNIKRLIQHL